jgi:hypothetical protein
MLQEPTPEERYVTTMKTLILLIAVTACLIIGSLGDEAVEPLSADAPDSDQSSFIVQILKAIENHDYRTLLDYTLGETIDYFGRQNSTNAYIEQDMRQDARSYRWCRFDPDFGTFRTSAGHDAIEYDSDAMDARGKEHKARCRLDIYYTPTPSPRLQALSLAVLPKHAATGISRPAVVGSAAGQDEQSGSPAKGLGDDAAIKRQLVGTWSYEGRLIVLNADGSMNNDFKTWDVQNGKYIETKKSGATDPCTILKLTKTSFTIREDYRSRGTGTWTRVIGQ